MLTSPDPKFDKQVRNTVEGMAHWAGTGPAGMCCGDCVFLVKRGGLGGYVCGEFARIMGYSPLQSIPRQTKSCNHFQHRRPPMLPIPTDQDLEQAADMKQPANASAPSKAQKTCSAQSENT